MFLHEDKDVFKEVVLATAESLGRTVAIVEKDYYVTMILKLLAEQYDNVVFKGGTSLSKAFHVIARFSEDIDVTFSEHIGSSRRKKLKNVAILGISKTLGLPIDNWDSLQSDRDVNSYIFGYRSISPSIGELSTGVKLETALGSYSFPTVEMPIDCYVYQYLLAINAEDLIVGYGLQPFRMQVQAVERTFIDKVFALCDYYMEGRSIRLSRHLYDLFKIYPTICFDDSFRSLFEEVRSHRASMDVCPSAKQGVDIRELLHEIIDSDYYRSDYESITTYFTSDSVEYSDAKRCLAKIAEEI